MASKVVWAVQGSTEGLLADVYTNLAAAELTAKTLNAKLANDLMMASYYRVVRLVATSAAPEHIYKMARKYGVIP